MKSITSKIFIIFFCLFLSLSPLCTKKADAAWIAAIDPMIKQAMEVMYRMIDKIGGGVMKQATAVALYKTMAKFVEGSSSGGSLFVQDWKEQLIQLPRDNSDNRINDLISKTVSGRGGQNYEGFGGDYLQTITKVAKAATSEKKAPRVNYEGNPREMFSQRDGFQKLTEYFSGINHPVASKNYFESEDARIMAEETKLAEVPRDAYAGFMPAGGLDNVSIPGSLLKDNIANIQDIGNKVLAGSDGMAETMITAILNQIITQMMLKGFN